MTISETKRLTWRRVSDGSYSLHLDRRTATILHAVPDATWPSMWRIRFADHSLSDLGNLTRIKDAGPRLGLSILNAPVQPTGETIAALPMRSLAQPARTPAVTLPSSMAA